MTDFVSNLAGNVAGGLARGGSAVLASNLLGSSPDFQQPLRDFQIARPSAGGLRTSGRGRNIRVQSTPERQGLVNAIALSFPEQAQAVRGIREQVSPGFGALTQARLGQLESARRRSIGNLRENLARRRVLGSSFAQDALSRAEAEFGQQAGQLQAQSFLEELDLTNRLINEEAQLNRNAFQTQLDELNLQADLASQLATGATSAISANARTLAQLNAQAAQGRGQFLGQAFGPSAQAIGDEFDQFVSGLFD